MDELINDLWANSTNDILDYRARFKEEYCEVEKALELLNLSVIELWQLVAQSKLTPCFLWDGLIKTEIDMNCADYNSHFRKGVFNEASYEAERRLGDIPCNCYVNFRGFITPDSTEPFIGHLSADTSEKFTLNKIRLIENLTNKKKLMLLGSKGSEREIEIDLKFYKHRAYTIYEKSSIKEFDPRKCVFLKSQINDLKSEIELDTIEKTDKNKRFTSRELYRLVIPTVIRYMRLKHNFKKPSQKDGKVGIKKAVLDYIDEDTSLKFLATNFDNDWQREILKKDDEGKSILDKIFDEE